MSSDFGDLPCIGDNFNLAVLNQGEKISDLFPEKEADPGICINDCSPGQPELRTAFASVVILLGERNALNPR